MTTRYGYNQKTLPLPVRLLVVAIPAAVIFYFTWEWTWIVAAVIGGLLAFPTAIFLLCTVFSIGRWVGLGQLVHPNYFAPWGMTNNQKERMKAKWDR